MKQRVESTIIQSTLITVFILSQVCSIKTETSSTEERTYFEAPPCQYEDNLIHQDVMCVTDHHGRRKILMKEQQKNSSCTMRLKEEDIRKLHNTTAMTNQQLLHLQNTTSVFIKQFQVQQQNSNLLMKRQLQNILEEVKEQRKEMQKQLKEERNDMQKQIKDQLKEMQEQLKKQSKEIHEQLKEQRSAIYTLEAKLGACNKSTDTIPGTTRDPVTDNFTGAATSATTGTTIDIRTAFPPPGFVYKPSVNSYYKVILQPLTWGQAQLRCTQEYPGAHGAVVTSAEEDRVIVEYLKSFNYFETQVCYHTSGQGRARVGARGFYTSGQRVIPGDCSKPFVWKQNSTTTFPLTYTSWIPAEPNCIRLPGSTAESCLHYNGLGIFEWNDVPCEFLLCALCEVNI